jgi:hypothetical protein
MRLPKKAIAAGFSVGIAAAVSALAVASVDGVAAPATPSAAVAGPRLMTTVVRRDVPVNGGVARISCPKTLRGGPSWVAVGGGVEGKNGYAVGGSYPVVDARGRAKSWAGTLTELPRVRPLGGRPEQGLTSDAGLSSYWRHHHHAILPSALLVRGDYKGYSSVRMYVVCASLVPSGRPYRLVTTIRSRDVPVDSDVARISCLKAVAGGVESSNG